MSDMEERLNSYITTLVENHNKTLRDFQMHYSNIHPEFIKDFSSAEVRHILLHYSSKIHNHTYETTATNTTAHTYNDEPYKRYTFPSHATNACMHVCGKHMARASYITGQSQVEPDGNVGKC